MKNGLKSLEKAKAEAGVNNPKFTLDKSLNKYSGVVLFPDKVAKGKEAIKHPSFKKLMDDFDNGKLK